MSGGSFDYKEQYLQYIADELEEDIAEEWFNHCDFTEHTLYEITSTILALRILHIKLRRIDYLFAGDDGEETFHKRLKEDLDSLTRLGE